MESYDDKKLKRRESDAKCRANITAGFDLLKEQVYASGSQEKVSKVRKFNNVYCLLSARKLLTII